VFFFFLSGINFMEQRQMNIQQSFASHETYAK